MEKLTRMDLYYGRTGLTIGNFEGMHKGHVKIISTLVNECSKNNLIPAVLTFKNHPVEVIYGKKSRQLWSPGDMICSFKQQGIELLLYIGFSPDFAALEPLGFLDRVWQDLFPRVICLGESFRFGKNNKGDTSFLEKYSSEYQYTLVKVKEVKDGGGPVSSTRIRRYIKNGQIDKANRLLGRSYQVYFKPAVHSPNTLEPFIEDTALPSEGIYKGQMIDLVSGRKQQASLKIADRSIRAPGIKMEEGVLYRFVFW
ncbi:MAG: hypothetical protein ACOC7U_06895 [Spirochaetota bacterium]